MKLRYILMFIASLFVAVLIYTQFFQFRFEVNRDLSQFLFYTRIGKADWKKNVTSWGGTVPLKVKKGETFTISLEGNRMNVAKWVAVSAETEYISFKDEKSVNMKRGLFEEYKEGEAPYQMQFSYKAVESGQMKLRLQLKPPSESGEMDDEYLCIFVDVSVE